MQGDRRERRSKVLRQRLLAGAAVIACAPFATVAAAQTGVEPTPPPTADGLAPEAVYVEADGVRQEGDVVTAEGTPENRVYLRTRGHTLRGESVSYDLNAGSAAAVGQVEAVAPDGTVVHASRLELDQNELDLLKKAGLDPEQVVKEFSDEIPGIWYIGYPGGCEYVSGVDDRDIRIDELVKKGYDVDDIHVFPAEHEMN